MTYAIINQDGICINRVLWDGASDWEPPSGCTAVYDPDNQHPIYVPETPPQETPGDILSQLTQEQKEALVALLQNPNG